MTVLYSAPPIPAGILKNPQESTGMAPESAGILRNPQEWDQNPQEWNWNGTGIE